MNRISAIEGEKASNAKSKRERLLPSIFPSACGNASAVRRLLDSHPCSRPFFPILCRRSVYEKIFWWEKKWLLDTVSRGGWHGSEFLVYLLVSFELNRSQHIISFDLFIFFLSIVSCLKTCQKIVCFYTELLHIFTVYCTVFHFSEWHPSKMSLLFTDLSWVSGQRKLPAKDPHHKIPRVEQIKITTAFFVIKTVTFGIGWLCQGFTRFNI